MCDITEDPLYDEIVRFTQRWASKKIQNPTPDSTIQSTQIMGEDVVEFMLDFRKKFGVDVTEFKSNLHFRNEALWTNFLMVPCWKLQKIYMKRTGKGKMIPITLSDLYEAAKTKKWKTPAREPKFLWEIGDPR